MGMSLGCNVARAISRHDGGSVGRKIHIVSVFAGGAEINLTMEEGKPTDGRTTAVDGRPQSMIGVPAVICPSLHLNAPADCQRFHLR